MAQSFRSIARDKEVPISNEPSGIKYCLKYCHLSFPCDVELGQADNICKGKFTPPNLSSSSSRGQLWSECCRLDAMTKLLPVSGDPAGFAIVPRISLTESSQLRRGLPLLLLPSITVSSTHFSRPSYLFRRPKYDSFCYLMYFKSQPSSTPNSSLIIWFVLLFIHGTLRIFLRHLFSKVVILFSSFFFRIQISQSLIMMVFSFKVFFGP